MGDPSVAVADLRKSYGAVEAVSGISFEIRRGEVFALLGHNGAGKTTTLEILEGYRNRSGGSVSVLGMDPARAGRALRERIGIVLQSAVIESYLTVGEVLELYGARYPDPRPVDEVLELVGLEAESRQRVKVLSGGQQRRLDLGLGLIGNPEILFLDEPTTGFDAAARRQCWEVVRNLSSLGMTILLTTHYMEEAHALATRVAIMSRGRIVAIDSPDVLIERSRLVPRVVYRPPAGVRVDDLPVPTVPEGDALRIDVSDQGELPDVLHRLATWALGAGVDLRGLTVSNPTLEQVYLEFTDNVEVPLDGSLPMDDARTSELRSS